ncbi:hypothetical protein PFICI_01171 [Pestalotiopsis fici W106-1]|uniref:AB hydrolase-1 domain-containing protein n=1 Tax=Pestalotiopsis fici (strain W106-1 / CGMCC3.15140) TaxID=1229662 RepID=W3XMS0_PESFW|nr:uncharacterized protein PFICI_01171 [Pestalotiopsis fici W106-1]ETS87343.1 hypothetical protein PFICI_01171 [Pestalotiopsis fici W106-1]
MARSNTLLLSLTAAALATTAAGRQCQNLTIPVTASARNGVFGIEAPQTNIDVTNFMLDLSQVGNNLTEKLLTGYATVSGTCNVAATYCEPDSGPGKALQVLVHGIGFDRSYWDFPADNYNYSYVDQALAAGYSTFAYDRPGIGQSQHGDPVNEIQSFLELAVLIELTSQLRAGQVESVATYDKTVHVGHSFGSIQTYGLAAQRPELTDAIALTGFSQNGSYNAEFALGGNFVQANSIPALGDYPDGYFASGSETGVQINFFGPGDFDPAILKAAYSTGQPVTVGELLTLAGPASVLNTYPGPVQIVTGERDIPFCGGNCSVTTPSVPEQAGQYFPNATYFDALVVPGAGHGLNLEYTWPVTYKTILDFFDEHL